MKRNKCLAFCLGWYLLLTLCTLTSAGDLTQADDQEIVNTKSPKEVQYEYHLNAGEPTEVYDVTFDKMVTVTVDPDSTRDAANNLRSDIHFDNCVFHGGLTIIGDYHAMVSLGSGCTFGEDSIVACKEATPDTAKGIVLDDNLIKLFVACEGVTVETEAAIGVLTDGPDVIFNDITYSKKELAPDTSFLGIYSLYEDETLTYVKLAIGENDSIEFLD